MENIIDRVYQIAEHKGVSISEFSKKINVSNGYLSKQKMNKANIGSHIIEKIVRAYPDINPSWLILGEGDAFKPTSKEISKRLERKGLFEDVSKIEKIGFDKYMENHIDNMRTYVDLDIPLLHKLIRVNRVKDLTDDFSNINGDIFMIDSFLNHYNLESQMIDKLKQYRNKEIDMNDLKSEFKKMLKKERELYELIKPFAQTISELLEVISDFNDKHDRIFCLDE